MITDRTDHRYTETGSKMLAYIQTEGRATTNMCFEQFEISRTGIQYHLDCMLAAGKIRRVSRGLYEAID
jgi:predicted HTH transcriptional regulator